MGKLSSVLLVILIFTMFFVLGGCTESVDLNAMQQEIDKVETQLREKNLKLKAEEQRHEEQNGQLMAFFDDSPEIDRLQKEIEQLKNDLEIKQDAFVQAQEKAEEGILGGWKWPIIIGFISSLAISSYLLFKMGLMDGAANARRTESSFLFFVSSFIMLILFLLITSGLKSLFF